MFWKNGISGLFLGGLLLSLYGCANQAASHDENTVSAPFALAAAVGNVDDGWLKNFNDPLLDSLLDEVLAAYPGLKITKAQVEQANGLTRQAGLDLKPSVDLSKKNKNNGYMGSGEEPPASIGISWESDVWGRIRTGVAGSEYAVPVTAADYHFARQSLLASVANGWFMATTAKLQKQLAEEVVALQDKRLEVADAMQIVGKGTTGDVHSARAALVSAQEAANSTRSAYESSLRSLGILLGRSPSADIDTVKTLVAVLLPIPTEIPSEIVERRPDLIAAEHKVAEAFYKQNEIEMLHLPRFQFSLGAGVHSLNDAIAGLVAGIFAPLYAGGEIEGTVDTATVKQEEAIAVYAQIALQAFQEIETSLAAENRLLEREEYLEVEVISNKVAYEQKNLQYELGQISILDVLTVQTKWIASKIVQLDMASKRLVNRVNLHLALGGSFDE